MFLHLLSAERAQPGHDVVGEQRSVARRLDEDAELRGPADLVLHLVEVGDDLAVGVDPVDRVGLELDRRLDDAPADEHDDPHGRERQGEAAGQAAHLDDHPTETALAEVTRARRTPVLPHAQDRERVEDRADADGDDADDHQPAERTDHGT